jgi:hypothetical protein
MIYFNEISLEQKTGQPTWESMEFNKNKGPNVARWTRGHQQQNSGSGGMAICFCPVGIQPFS